MCIIDRIAHTAAERLVEFVDALCVLLNDGGAAQEALVAFEGTATVLHGALNGTSEAAVKGGEALTYLIVVRDYEFSRLARCRGAFVG